MKRIALLVLLTLLSLWAFAEGGYLVFKSIDHQFGDVPEAGGEIRHTFEFTNKGDAPVIIYGVSASCGCTATEWSKEPILPGKKGTITAIFQPLGRPYSFSKTITVRTNSQPATVVLTIRGFVIPKNATQESLYSQRLGAVGLRSFYQLLGDVSHLAVEKVEIPVWNASDKPQEVTLGALPTGLSGKTKLKLNPGEIKTFELELQAKKLKEWGQQSLELVIRCGTATGSFYLHFTRVEDFSKLSLKEREKAARLELPTSRVSFDKAKTGDVVEQKMELKNVGGAPLIIRKVVTNSSQITYTLDKEEIPAGQSGWITFRFDTKGYYGEQVRNIQIIVNDPQGTTQTLELAGTLE
jgi:hypothetical protein